jgi:hypothetical protein
MKERNSNNHLMSQKSWVEALIFLLGFWQLFICSKIEFKFLKHNGMECNGILMCSVFSFLHMIVYYV